MRGDFRCGAAARTSPGWPVRGEKKTALLGSGMPRACCVLHPTRAGTGVLCSPDRLHLSPPGSPSVWSGREEGRRPSAVTPCHPSHHLPLTIFPLPGPSFPPPLSYSGCFPSPGPAHRPVRGLSRRCQPVTTRGQQRQRPGRSWVSRLWAPVPQGWPRVGQTCTPSIPAELDAAPLLLWGVLGVPEVSCPSPGLPELRFPIGAGRRWVD